MEFREHDWKDFLTMQTNFNYTLQDARCRRWEKFVAEVTCNDEDKADYDPSSVVVAAKTNWAMGDTPTQSLVKAYLNNLTVLRKQLTLPSDAPLVPSSLDNLTFSTANNIEYLLYVIDTTLTEVETELYSKIDRTVDAFAYVGLYNCGE